jgi:NADP-dependent 3-hydroxy acid dehydrogenase YdfG
MIMSNNIEGKVVVITGVSCGLGEATPGGSPRRALA